MPYPACPAGSSGSAFREGVFYGQRELNSCQTLVSNVLSRDRSRGSRRRISSGGPRARERGHISETSAWPANVRAFQKRFAVLRNDAILGKERRQQQELRGLRAEREEESDTVRPAREGGQRGLCGECERNAAAAGRASVSVSSMAAMVEISRSPRRTFVTTVRFAFYIRRGAKLLPVASKRTSDSSVGRAFDCSGHDHRMATGSIPVRGRRGILLFIFSRVCSESLRSA